MSRVLPDDATVSSEGHLVVGGCDTPDLARRYGTPVIVLDRATFESRAKAFASVLEPNRVFYAAKAFVCTAICELLDQLGLSLDVCSRGELATARAASFPLERALFHGNNKSVGELELARDAGVGRLVVDSFDEIERLAEVGYRGRLLIRVTPGVEAHTHQFVQTGQEDSKFGFTLADGVALEALKKALRVPGCELVGVHAHIGSQILDLDAFDVAVKRVCSFLTQAHKELGFRARELNLGGGLGIAHTQDEAPPDPAAAARRVVAAVEREMAKRKLPVPEVAMEPGRALVGQAGITLYSVGTVKRIPSVRTYVSVDGGMSDNIRPALYASRYEALLANRMNAPTGSLVTVAGKHCESGDVLIRDVELPEDVACGDLLCTPATGAYTYSMASNYNRLPRPPVVMVSDGEAVEIVARETDDDLLRLDRRLDGSRR